MTEDQIYFQEAAWGHLRQATEFKRQGRRAKAQQTLLEAFYYAQKVPSEFMDRELAYNLDAMSKSLMRGY